MGILRLILYAIISLLTIAYFLIKKRFSYWKDRGIPYNEPSFPNGNVPRYKQGLVHESLKKLYDEHKHKTPLLGFFNYIFPGILAIDLDLVKNILIKDFTSFTDRGMYYNEKDDPLSAHLFSLDGGPWQPLRKKLSPTFTSGKMKFMYPTIVKVGEEFSEVFSEILKKNSEIEVKELLARFTTDVIGTCAFGIDCNSLKDPNAKFRLMGRKIFIPRKHGYTVSALLMGFPAVGRFFGMKMNHDDVTSFFLEAVKDTVAYRQKNNINRNDFIDILLSIKSEKSIVDENGQSVKTDLTIEQIAAQAFVFFIAGFETSSTTMGFLLYEIAKNQTIQNRMRKEIEEVIDKHDGQVTYECFKDMQFMDQVISETLRKYPVVPFLSRRALVDYKVPDSSYTIPKGTITFVPVYAIHYDSETYPNPEKFDPSRFTPQAIQSRHPEAWIPFGDGPRNCIGLRFGKLQARIGLVSLLRKFKFSCCDKTPTSFKYDTQNPLLASIGGIILKVEKV